MTPYQLAGVCLDMVGVLLRYLGPESSSRQLFGPVQGGMSSLEPLGDHYSTGGGGWSGARERLFVAGAACPSLPLPWLHKAHPHIRGGLCPTRGGRGWAGCHGAAKARMGVPFTRCVPERGRGAASCCKDGEQTRRGRDMAQRAHVSPRSQAQGLVVCYREL